MIEVDPKLNIGIASDVLFGGGAPTLPHWMRVFDSRASDPCCSAKEQLDNARSILERYDLGNMQSGFVVHDFENPQPSDVPEWAYKCVVMLSRATAPNQFASLCTTYAECEDMAYAMKILEHYRDEMNVPTLARLDKSVARCMSFGGESIEPNKVWGDDRPLWERPDHGTAKLIFMLHNKDPK